MEGSFIPKYTSHTTMNCLVALPLGYLGFFYQNLFNSELVITAGVSFLLSTLLLSPDLDLFYSTPTKNWGILKFIWYGYPKVFSHRGLSHSLFLSALTKIIYLILVAGFCYFVFAVTKQIFRGREYMAVLKIAGEDTYLEARDFFEYLLDHRKHLMAFFVGLLLSDWIHIIVDRLYTGSKRRKFRF